MLPLFPVFLSACFVFSCSLCAARLGSCSFFLLLCSPTFSVPPLRFPCFCLTPLPPRRPHFLLFVGVFFGPASDAPPTPPPLPFLFSPSLLPPYFPRPCPALSWRGLGSGNRQVTFEEAVRAVGTSNSKTMSSQMELLVLAYSHVTQSSAPLPLPPSAPPPSPPSSPPPSPLLPPYFPLPCLALSASLPSSFPPLCQLAINPPCPAVAASLSCFSVCVFCF